MPTIEMISLRELLQDPDYKKYFTKVPVLPAHYTPDVKPWKLYVLKAGEDKWRSKRYGTYGDAFAGLKKMLPSIDNAAINCPGLSFMPPIKNYRIKGRFLDKAEKKPLIKSVVWKPKIDADMAGHNWCPHCRRPTVFKMAGLPARRMGDFVLPPDEVSLRCSICGASERIVDLRHPEVHQAWDPTRPRMQGATK